MFLCLTQHFGAMTSQRRKMNLQKLLTIRNGYRRLIVDELTKFDTDETSTCEYERLLRLVTETVEEVKMTSEKIIYHNDVEDMATELVESKTYSFEL